MSTCYDIWGFKIQLHNIDKKSEEEVYENFYGAIQPLENCLDTDLKLELLPDSDVYACATEPERKMHGGGSSAQKYFTNGTLFETSSQERTCRVIGENPEHAIYNRGNAIVISSSGNYLILAKGQLPGMLICDLIENFLLYKSKQAGWIMMHGAGWLLDNKLGLVIGESGAGKTTTLLSKIQQGAGFFSNDRVFVRINKGRLEARSFPLPVNIGCGTIRSLGLNIPDFNFPDRYKIRLTPKEVYELFPVDFNAWYEIESILVRSYDELAQNIYWDFDENHPFWNRVYQPNRYGKMEELNKMITSLALLKEAFIK